MNESSPQPLTQPGAFCADVAIDVPAAAHGQSVYTWQVPPRLVERIRVGHLVWVPLRRGADLGLVVRLHHDPPDGVDLKPITGLVRPAFLLSDDEMTSVRWIARETASTLYASASPFFPPGVEHRTTEAFELIDADDPRIADLPPMPRRIIELLAEHGEMTSEQIRRAMGRNQPAALRLLEEEGFVERTLGVEDRTPKQRLIRYVRLIEFDPDAVARSEKQREALELLAQRSRLLGDSDDLMPVADLTRQSGASSSVISALEKKGLIEIVELPARPTTFVEETSPPVLSPAQADAWRVIETAIDQRDPTPILAYGVTGSGKTELYLRMAGRALRDGKSMIMLVPEIVLATQIVERFEARFPGQIAVLHSAQNASQRYAVWKSVQTGEKRIVVGPRSALFAPVSELACIAIDEEQDAAFKQESAPRYHARSLAEQIVRVRRCALVLGSATPAVETAWRTTREMIRRVDLPERVRFGLGGVGASESRESAAMPTVMVIDMRKEARTTGATLISTPLITSIERALGRHQQAVVLLNRRGMSTIVICRSCGQSTLCPHCDIPLVFHRDVDQLFCHRCNLRVAPPRSCEFCGGPMDYFGAGTQRVEQEMSRLFPGSSVLRIDRDSIKALGGFAAVLRRVEEGEADIVVGTQLVAKGLDFPRVTSVGVIQADSQLYFPDFRSAERTFQLISQVAGRAGRRAANGEVIVQTYTPEHYAITAAANHSYEDFYIQEITFRQRFRYPPFTRLARYLFRSGSEDHCREEGDLMAAELRGHAQERGVAIDVIGPAPAFVAKIRGEYQWQLILRAAPDDFERLLSNLPARPGWIVDIDPSSMT